MSKGLNHLNRFDTSLAREPWRVAIATQVGSRRCVAKDTGDFRRRESHAGD
jgi:hypothetical protein